MATHEWVTLRVASARAGVSVSTLRNWYRDGKVEAKDEPSRYGPAKLVRYDQVEALAATLMPREAAEAAGSVAVPASALGAALEALAATVRDQAETIMAQNRLMESLMGQDSTGRRARDLDSHSQHDSRSR